MLVEKMLSDFACVVVDVAANVSKGLTWPGMLALPWTVQSWT